MIVTTHRSARRASSKEKKNVSHRGRQSPLYVDFASLGHDELEAMAKACDEVLECQRVLAKGGSNVVAEVLPREGTFYQFDHCPAGDVYDRDSHSQYYYHAHRDGEHGHFHTFLREAGMPPGAEPVEQSQIEVMKQRNDRLSHIVAISMDRRGFPIALFTTNRWVTGENWYAAPDVVAMLDCFDIDHARPSWPTNRWVSAMIRLFRPQIAALLGERDAVVAAWKARHPDKDVFEDRNLDLPSKMAISIDNQIGAIRKALGTSR